MTTILKPGGATSPATAGGKAAALAALARARLSIPQWFAVSPEAFAASFGGDPTDSDALARLAPSGDVRAAVDAAVAELCPNGEPVAVRSSAVDEDGAEHSFAGQLDSYLYVAPADVAARVVDVWRSGFSPRLLAYRKERGLGQPVPPAVLVQRMVDAAVSGVAFSADPVAGDRGVAIVAAVYGLGAALVSGTADADTYGVDRLGAIVRREIARKTSAARRDPAAPEGISTQPIESALALAPALTDDEVRAVADLARAAARHFGRPQDIEWAIEDGRLYLLQSRPITSLAGLPDTGGVLQLWDNSNIAESYGGVTTPLTFSFARGVYEEVYRQFLRILGVREAAVAGNAGTLARMLGLVRGRIYYNLGSWYRILALLPGFTVNRRFMEQMMGVKEEMPAGLLPDTQPATSADRVRDRVDVARMAMGLLRSHNLLAGSIDAFYARLNDALRPGPIPLTEMRADELAAHYRDLERRLITSWDAPLVNDFFAMIYFGLLSRIVKNWCGDENGTLQNDLMCGQGGIISAEPARRVREMAAAARQHPELVAALCDASVDDILAAIDEHPAFRTLYDAYVERFGDRCLDELKLESLTLHDDPLLLLRSIGRYARTHAGAEAAGDDGALAVAAEAGARRRLGPNPVRRLLFGRILVGARGRLRDRENLRFERTRLFGRVRRIFVEIGKRLAADGVLKAPRDVFYLEVEEVLGYVEGTATTTDLAKLVALRRAEFDGYSEGPAPAGRFETRGVAYQGNVFQSAAQKAEPAESPTDSLRGTGCCPGIVRGPVRIVRDPQSAALSAGEILVAERTDPGWIMLFAAAAGLLVERGSLLSHSAIVSREMRIPGIVALAGLMDWLHDGDWVEMDGATGIVRRVDPPEAADAK